MAGLKSRLIQKFSISFHVGTFTAHLAVLMVSLLYEARGFDANIEKFKNISHCLLTFMVSRRISRVKLSKASIKGVLYFAFRKRTLTSTWPTMSESWCQFSRGSPDGLQGSASFGPSSLTSTKQPFLLRNQFRKQPQQKI